MAQSDDFLRIVDKIRDALIIPTYGISDFYGTGVEFEIFNETLSNGELSLSPYAGEKPAALYSMDTVKDRYPEAVNLTNWRNLSFLHTYYNFYNNNDMKGNRLPLEIQGVSNQVVSSLTPPFNLQFKPKSSWEQLLTDYLLKTKGTTGKTADNYFLFVPDAEPEIRPQSISFTDNYFGIICLRWSAKIKDWLYQAWWFLTPSKYKLRRPDEDGTYQATQEFFCENSFPLRNFKRSQEEDDYASVFWIENDAVGVGEWLNGDAWAVEGGGFYLGQDAKPFLDLFPKTKPELTKFGLFNWWW